MQLAGYVCHRLIKQLELPSMPSRNDNHIQIWPVHDEGDDTAEPDWTNLLDWGGLFQGTYMFFVAMDEEVHLSQTMKTEAVGQHILK